MPHPAQQITLQEYIDAVRSCTQRVERMTDQIRQLAKQWRMGPVIQAIQALRGVSLIVATTTIAELGDLTRFNNPRQLMAYLGLVPSEHSSGETVKRGGINKTGNGHARRMLVESAWSYRFPARVSLRLRERQQNVPQAVWESAIKALCPLSAVDGQGQAQPGRHHSNCQRDICIYVGNCQSNPKTRVKEFIKEQIYQLLQQRARPR